MLVLRCVQLVSCREVRLLLALKAGAKIKWYSGTVVKVEELIVSVPQYTLVANILTRTTFHLAVEVVSLALSISARSEDGQSSWILWHGRSSPRSSGHDMSINLRDSAGGLS